jgi:hypothetical protein
MATKPEELRFGGGRLLDLDQPYAAQMRSSNP